MPPTLQDIHSHLEQGYFLQEDMDLLGLKGYVTLAQMEAEVRSLSTLSAPPPVQGPDPEQQRWEASQRAALKEANEAAQRAILIQAIADEQQKAKEKVALEAFDAALAVDPTVVKVGH